MVVMKEGVQASSQNRRSKQDFPTPVSATKRVGGREGESQLVGSEEEGEAEVDERRGGGR
jgi:hypothetical protein